MEQIIDIPIHFPIALLFSTITLGLYSNLSEGSLKLYKSLCTLSANLPLKEQYFQLNFI